MLKRVLAHIVAFVAVLLVVAFAPIITLAATVWMASLNRVDPDEITASILVAPVLCAFWYMFVASITRAARSKREGVSPRTGFFWAGGRLFGGWIMSLASAILAVLAVSQLVGAFRIDSPSYILFPALFLGVWSPVIVNLLRHFMRYFTPRSSRRNPSSEWTQISSSLEAD
jgi:hypothetical protein